MYIVFVREFFNELFTNVKSLKSITGIYTYREISILPADLPKNTNVISIVITRWNAIDLRNAVRDMYASGTKNTALNYKLVFLFNIHSGC